MASAIARTALINSARQRTAAAALSPISFSEWSNVIATSTPSRIIPGQHPQAGTPLQYRSLSSEEKPGLLDRMKNALSDREQKKQADKYAEQLEKMSNLEEWNMKTFSDEINQSLSSWRMKIPGMSNVEQVKAVKEQQKVVDAIKDEIGENGSVDDIAGLGRKEKLKISLRSGIAIEDINMLIKQFQSMDVMHKILRHRKKSGKDIPQDEQTLKALIQKEGKNVLSREQKQNMRKSRSKAAMKGFR